MSSSPSTPLRTGIVAYYNGAKLYRCPGGSRYVEDCRGFGNRLNAAVVLVTSEWRLSLDETELVQRAQAGDLAAYEQLVGRYEDAAFRTAYLVLRDRDDAADAAQEAFLRAYRGLRGFQTGRQFRPWLLRIVVNQALNMRKAKARRRAATERLAGTQPLPQPRIDESVIERERARALWSALEALGERERTVLYLRYFLAMPERELAEYMGCAPGTVKSRLHRALRKLRDVIERLHPELLRELA